MKHKPVLAILLLTAFLAACGGGGGTPVIVNSAPLARAGADQSVTTDALVALDGSSSSDADKDPLSYVWTLVAKPAGSSAVLANAASATPTFSADVAGVYSVTLVVNDGKLNSNASSLRITVTPVNVAGPGRFIAAELLRSISGADIAAALAQAGEAAFLATPRYAVQAYRLSYLTVDGKGQEIVASALLALPQKPADALSPVLSYQHETLTRQASAPSNLTNLDNPSLVLASLGYIVLSADYVGYGVSQAAAHPYLLSAPSAAAVTDLLTAAKYWRQAQQVPDNKQLFLTGYSEGGYVTMAAQRALQAGTSKQRSELVSVLAGAGPYNVGLTLDEQLKIVRSNNLLLGLLLDPGFLKYLSDADRNNVRDLLLAQVLGSDADVTFMPTALDNFLADDRAALASLSDVYDWRPEVPVTLFHGRDDQTVSYLNASSTLQAMQAMQAMQARGAGNRVTLTDCTAQPAGHLQCALPYLQLMLDQFGKLARDL